MAFQKVKPNGMPINGAVWVRFYASAWRSGSIGLTLEEEGAYMRVCAHTWETGRRVPLDEREASSRLMLDVRTWRRVRDALVKKGKLHVGEDGIYSRRAEYELAVARRAAGQTAPEAPEPVGASRGSDAEEHEDGRAEVCERSTPRSEVLSTSQGTSAGHESELSEIVVKKENEIRGPFTETESESEKDKSPLGGFDDPANADGIEVSGYGTVRLLNGVRQFWLEEFGGDEHRLDLALRQVVVQPNSRRPLRAQVESQLARQAADRRDRDARYQQAAAANRKPSQPQPRSPDQIDWDAINRYAEALL